MILPGSASQSLSAALAAELGEDLAPVEYRTFPDGERLVEVPAQDGRAVVVAATLDGEAHVEALLLQDAAREAGAEEVVTVLPYMGYARQDRAFRSGQPVSARAVARALSPGTDRVVTVNPHEEAVLDFFDVRAESVNAAGRLAAPLPDDLSDPVFLSPDDGALDVAGAVRDSHGDGDVDFFEKRRDRGTGEIEMRPSEVDVAGRDVIVADDIIATGSTMSEAIALLRARDSSRVFVACVHPLLVGNARARLATAGVEAVYGTDTIERAVSEVSVAPVLADAL